MLGKMLRGWKLPILCVLFATCGGGLVKDPGPTTELFREGANATLVRGVYRLLPDGTMILPRPRTTSSYAQGEDEAASLNPPPPECRDIFASIKPFYYAMMSFFLQLQVPFLVSANQSFNMWNPFVFLLLVTWLVVANMSTILCNVPQYPNMATYYILPSHLSVYGLNLAGGLAVLHSAPVMACLSHSRHIFVRKGTVFIRNNAYVFNIGAFGTGALISCATFLFVSSSRPTPDFSNIRKDILGGFLPSCVTCLVFNLMLWTPAAVSGDAWRTVRDRYQTFLKFFVAAFVNWMLGYVVAVTGFWKLWDAFVVFSFVYTIVLWFYIYHISRKVIYADRKCAKILEMDGDVLTIWNDPPTIQERSGTGKEEQLAGEKLQLAWILLPPWTAFQESLTVGNDDHEKV